MKNQNDQYLITTQDVHLSMSGTVTSTRGNEFPVDDLFVFIPAKSTVAIENGENGISVTVSGEKVDFAKLYEEQTPDENKLMERVQGYERMNPMSISVQEYDEKDFDKMAFRISKSDYEDIVSITDDSARAGIIGEYVAENKPEKISGKSAKGFERE